MEGQSEGGVNGVGVVRLVGLVRVFVWVWDGVPTTVVVEGVMARILGAYMCRLWSESDRLMILEEEQDNIGG